MEEAEAPESHTSVPVHTKDTGTDIARGNTEMAAWQLPQLVESQNWMVAERILTYFYICLF